MCSCRILKDSEEDVYLASIRAFIKEAKAELWIEHDISANSRQKKSPEYYDQSRTRGRSRDENTDDRRTAVTRDAERV